MKIILSLLVMFTGTSLFAQTKTENEIIQLSNEKFRLEMKNDADSMANILDDNFIGISSTGIKRNKVEYLANIKNTATIHNSMDIQETNVSIVGNTAILTGKGIFVITANNVKSTQHLFYMQIFAKGKHGWKMVALQGGRLSE